MELRQILLELFFAPVYLFTGPLFTIAWLSIIVSLFLLSGQMHPATSSDGSRRRWNPVFGILRPNLLTPAGKRSRCWCFYAGAGLILSIIYGLIFDAVWKTDEFHWTLRVLTIWLSTTSVSILPLWICLRELYLYPHRLLTTLILIVVFWVASHLLLFNVGTQFGIQGESQLIFALFFLINGMIFFISGLFISHLYSENKNSQPKQ